MERRPYTCWLGLAAAMLITAAGCAPTGLGAVGPTPTGIGPIQISETEVADGEVAIPPGGTEGSCENPYYPVEDGAAWVYALAGAEDFPSTSTMSVNPVDENEFLVTTVSEDRTSAEKGHCTEDGIAFWDEPGVSATFTSGAGSSSASTTASVGVSLPSTIEVGDQWTQRVNVVGSEGSLSVLAEFEAVAAESVEVPAGTFQALRVDRHCTIQFSGQEIMEDASLWYAEGVGMVRTLTTLPAGAGELDLVLLSYDIPD